MTYTVHRSARSRHIRIRVGSGGTVSVSAPRHLSETKIEAYVAKQAAWIVSAKDRIQKKERNKELPGADVPRHRFHARAKQYILARVKALNQTYGFVYGRISIKDTATRWGSCSAKKNLNFHYRLLFLPPRLSDYVIVHELCHLQELNHSPRFWQLLAQAIPDYATCRSALRAYRLS